MATSNIELIVSAVMGLCGGLLTIPLTALFTWLIERYKANRQKEIDGLKIQQEHKNNIEKIELELLRKHQYELRIKELEKTDNDTNSINNLTKRIELIEQQMVLSTENILLEQKIKNRNEIAALNLQDTSSGNELAQLIAAPYKFTSEFETPTTEGTTNVALWGPVGSGKSCLISAFSASLYKYTSNKVVFSLEYDDKKFVDPFEYPSIDFVPATASPSDHFYYFSRRFKKNGASSQISSYLHKLTIHDDMGGHLMGMLDEPDEYQMTSQTILSADGIIIALDPTFLIPDNDIFNDDLSYHGGFTRREYTDVVSKLCTFLENRKKTIHLAFCLMKSDTLRGYSRRTAITVIENIFGKEMSELIKSQNSARAFTTSSFGFHPVNPKDWEPFGVEFPFFWIFETMERAKLEQDTSGVNIFRRNNLSQYIPYPFPE